MPWQLYPARIPGPRIPEDRAHRNRLSVHVEPVFDRGQHIGVGNGFLPQSDDQRPPVGQVPDDGLRIDVVRHGPDQNGPSAQGGGPSVQGRDNCIRTCRPVDQMAVHLADYLLLGDTDAMVVEHHLDAGCPAPVGAPLPPASGRRREIGEVCGRHTGNIEVGPQSGHIATDTCYRKKCDKE